MAVVLGRGHLTSRTDDTMKLHYIQGSPFARMVRVLTRELDLNCEEVEITDFPPPPEHFSLNPLGQVPVLEIENGALFPTSVILEFLVAAKDGRVILRRSDSYWTDSSLFAVLLAWADMVVAQGYQAWGGLRATGENVLGFDIAKRRSERIGQTLDWLETQASPSGFMPGVLSVQDIVLACTILWTESRSPMSWRGRRALEAIVAMAEARPSFVDTVPRPWQPGDMNSTVSAG